MLSLPCGAPSTRRTFSLYTPILQPWKLRLWEVYLPQGHTADAGKSLVLMPEAVGLIWRGNTCKGPHPEQRAGDLRILQDGRGDLRP